MESKVWNSHLLCILLPLFIPLFSVEPFFKNNACLQVGRLCSSLATFKTNFKIFKTEMEDTAKVGGRGCSWKVDETRALIAIWGEENIQMQLNKSHRNICVYEKIAAQLSRKGFSRSSQECRTKCKSLKRSYKKAAQLSRTSGMGAINIPFFKELEEIFAGDASVEPKRAAGGNRLEFRHLEDTDEPMEMPPDTQSSDDLSTSAGSEDLFSQEAQAGTILLNLTPVNDDIDLTQIGENIENNSNANVQHKDSQDVNMCPEDEDNECEFPNLQPVKPSATYVARQRQSLTPQEKLAMIKRRNEKSACVQMCEKLIQCSKENVQMIIENSNDRLSKEMNWKEMYFEKTNANFMRLISVLEDFSSTYKEACSELKNKDVRVFRRVKRKLRTQPQNVQLTPENNELGTGTSENEPCTSRIQVQDTKVVRSQRLIRKPIPFSP